MTLLSIEQPPYVTLCTTNEYFSSVFDLCQLVQFGPGHVTGWDFGSRGCVRCRAGQGPGGTSPMPPRPNGHSGGDWWAPGGCFFNKTACRFHLIVDEAKFAWGVFSCRARFRPNQANVSTMGVVCTIISHRSIIIGDPGPKKVTFSMPHRPIDWCPYRPRA